MALVIKDRVKESTSFTGTGAVALAGAIATFDRFQSAMANGDTTYYAIVHTSSGVDEWEVGLGTYVSATDNLTRTTVLAGSNGTSAVDFSAGLKDVFMTYPAAIAAYTDGSGDLSALIGLGNHTTDDLTQGGTNKYYADSLVDSHLSGGTGVTYSSGAISIGQDVGTTADVTFNSVTTTDGLTVGADLTVTGNLTVNGTTTTINATELAIEDNLIYLNDGSTITNPDLGWVGNYNDGTYQHAGVFRDATDGRFKFFDSYVPEPDSAIDVSHATYADADVQGGTFYGSFSGPLTGNVTGDVTGNLTGNVTGNVVGNVTGNVTGNASTATALQTTRTISLTGDATGSATFNGTANAAITVTVVDDSHNHIISNVDGLQTALDGKVPTTRTITAGTGITGGGDLSANRSFAFDTTFGDARYVIASTFTESVEDIVGAMVSSNTESGIAVTYDDINGKLNFDVADPTITLTGAVTGSATMTNLGNVTITTAATSDPTLTINGDATGSATFTNLGNATLTLSVVDDSHTHDGRYYTETEVGNFFSGTTAITGYNKANWDTAYGWGNHASAGYLLSSSYTASDVLTKLLTVDGTTSGLDADLLDGQHGSYYLDYNNATNTPTIGNATITISAGSGMTGGGTFTTNQTGAGTITISHSDTSSQTSVNNSGRTYIQDITLDTYGHVTGITSATETVVDTNTTSLPVENSAGTVQFTSTDTTGIQFAASGAASVAFDAANQRVTFSSTDTNTTYSAGALLDLTGTTFDVDLSELTYMTATMASSDEFVVLDAAAQRRKAANEIGLSIFNNDSGFTTNTGTVTSVAATAGTGISISGSPITTSGTLTITNTAPDQVVSLTGSGATSISGTYPNFTISSTDTNTTYSAGNGISLSGTTFSVAAGSGLTQDASGLSHADTSTQASLTALTGANVVSDIDLDTYGHVTAIATRAMTAADLGAITGNQTITLSGDVSGSGTTSIVVTVADDSHNHIISNVDGLQTALDAKAPLASPALTGTPTAPTAAVGTNTTQVATTAFVNAEIANDAPTKTGGGASGTWGISISGNAATATTATKWDTARTLSLTGAVTGSTTIDGSGNVSIATTATSDPVITLTGAVTGSGTMTNLGNVSIATTATADPTLTINGDASGSATFTNLGNATLTLTIADDSHNHVISNVDGLQTALDAKGPVGGGSDKLFYENDQTMTTSYTIAANKNAMTTGPITVNSGVVLTVSSGARYVVI